MAIKRNKPEEIVTKLRQVEVRCLMRFDKAFGVCVMRTLSPPVPCLPVFANIHKYSR